MKTIISSKEHLAFPNLIYYKDSWYLTYRRSDRHVHGSYSNIEVMAGPIFKIGQSYIVFHILTMILETQSFHLMTTMTVYIFISMRSTMTKVLINTVQSVEICI